MRFFSTTEAAARLKLDPSRVRLLCRQGRIKAIMVGGTYVIEEVEFDRFAAIPRPPGRPRHDNAEPLEPSVASNE
jgi:excisionase family DNA binding protein